MQPLEKFQKSLKFLRSLFKYIGQDVFADHFRRGKVFYVIFFLMLPEILFHPIDLLWTNDLDESTRFIQASMFTGVSQILLKFYWLKDLHALRPVVAFLEDIYRKNSQPTDEYYEICRRYARFTDLMFRTTAASYMGIVAFVLISAFIESFSSMKPAYCFYFPIFHEYSLIQLVCLDTFIGMAGLFSVPVMPAGDLYIYLIVGNLTMIPSIIASQMNELSERLEKRQATATEIKRRWMHYIVIQQEYIR